MEPFLAPFLWALYLSLPAAIAALHVAGYLAVRIPLPWDQKPRVALLLRIALFIVITPASFCALLAAAVALMMWLWT